MAGGRQESSALTVGDIYCGAGGFSEGFRQAGFDVRWGIDKWAPAVETFRQNHPESKVISADVMTVDTASLEPVDVVIGSPPCTYFSMANRAGSGDKTTGLSLVKRFFEIVKDLDPTYWIMENVPPLHGTLLQELDGDIVSLANGNLKVPRLEVLVASDYGAPQRRRRLFSGKYPPIAHSGSRNSSPLTLGSVLESLPDPCKGTPSPRRTYTDPLYPSVEAVESQLGDHFEDSRFRLSRAELAQCKSQKIEHRYGGAMDWPDRLDRPSRTITATRTRTSRSTIVVRCPQHGGKRAPLRSLTLRECASIQGFPTTYGFWANSLSSRENLVGNAVSPILSRALARAILRSEGRPIPIKLKVHVAMERPSPVSVVRRRRFRYSTRRPFRRFVRVDWRPDCRVELENIVTRPAEGGTEQINPTTRWVSRVYLGYAKEFRCYEVPFEKALEVVQQSDQDLGHFVSVREAVEKLVREAATEFQDLPNGNVLQLAWSGRFKGASLPQGILPLVERLVDSHFPPKSWAQVRVPRGSITKLFGPLLHNKGKNADSTLPIDLPVRTLAALVTLSLACSLINSKGGDKSGRAMSDSELDACWSGTITLDNTRK